MKLESLLSSLLEHRHRTHRRHSISDRHAWRKEFCTKDTPCTARVIQ